MALMRGAEPVVAKAAATLVEMQRAPRATTRKELRDIVTDADLAAERIVIDGLKALTPGAAILSEERGFTGGASPSRWIIDPLDGTVNYAGGLPWWSVTAAYQEAGAIRIGIVHAPRMGIVARYAADELATVNGEAARVSAVSSLSDAVVSVIITSHFSAGEVARGAEIVRRLGDAARGVRIVVSGGLEMTLVASAQLDAYVSLKADIVSHAAAMPLVRAAGGRVTTLDGVDSRDEDLEKITSNGLIHDELLALLRGV
jgi:myo-inositol-1(or 4)-monophosphatase